MKAVILAGGIGQRLRPLTCTVPKPMVPVMNRPVMQYSIELLRKHGIKDIDVTLAYLGERISSHFGDGRQWGVSMRYFTEDKPLGTAGSVYATGNNETLIIVSGDALTDIDLSEIIEFHRQKECDATIVLKRIDIPYEYGIVITQENGQITQFVEKPDISKASSDLINTGIYIIEPSVFEGFERGSNFDFAKHVFPRLLDHGKKLYGCITEGYWCDIGDTAQYKQAHDDIFAGKCCVTLHAQNDQGIYVENGAIIESGSMLLPPCYIGAGVSIASGAMVESGSIIGAHSQIENGASIKRSILWNGVCIKERAHVRGAIICDGVRLSAKSAVYEGAVIASHCEVGESAVVKPDVRVWPEKHIPDGQIAGGDYMWTIEPSGSPFASKYGIMPETAVRIGRAFAGQLNYARIGVASDGNMKAVPVKSGVCAGLLSAGGEVFDCENAHHSILSFAARALKLDGAIYVHSKDDAINISFYDEQGIEYLSDFKKKIAHCLASDDSALIRPGILRMKLDITPFYIADLMSSVDIVAMRKNAASVCINARGRGLEIIKEVMGACGWSVAEFEARDEMLRFLNKRGILGFNIADELEMHVDGDTLSVDEVANLCALIDAIAGHKLLLVDAAADSVMETIARQRDVKVKRMHRAELVRALDKGSFLHSVYTDPFRAMIKLCDYNANGPYRIAELMENLPRISRRERVITVAARDIGRMLRKIAEDKPLGSVERIEGVRIKNENGWVHLLPNHAGTRMRIISNSFSEEYAESIADLYSRRVRELSKKDK